MLRKNPPEGEQKLVDQALLRALLHRSNYSSADLRAHSGGNHAREVVIINRIREGMVTSTTQAAVRANVVLAEAADLLRWEGEGGSPSSDDHAVTPVRRGT